MLGKSFDDLCKELEIGKHTKHSIESESRLVQEIYEFSNECLEEIRKMMMYKFLDGRDLESQNQTYKENKK